MKIPALLPSFGLSIDKYLEAARSYIVLSDAASIGEMVAPASMALPRHLSMSYNEKAYSKQCS